ncbi:ECF transporter S component [Clostridium pasteurianum]|uniref:Putative membrane protein n=1 Tax=Clostridium pasteurianum BC1 TaxID=86416 RepID=R4KCB3_CLOPA|nr:ECF transporter S component [Clostridium pasteurianum]AGK97260.1 putative membrane protein [Clostridium pasteurianum BC1]
MKQNIGTNKKFGVRQLTVVGMLSGISIMLGITGWGYIKLPILQATIMHVPVIIGAIIEGPMVGMCIGLIFGISSIIQNIMTPSLLSFALINPLVSVLPRILIALTSYYAYKFTIGNNKALKIGIGAAIGSVTNTVGVLGMIYLLYIKEYAIHMKISAAAANKVILGIAIANGIPEMIAAICITVPIVLAVTRIRKR